MGNLHEECMVLVEGLDSIGIRSKLNTAKLHTDVYTLAVFFYYPLDFYNN